MQGRKNWRAAGVRAPAVQKLFSWGQRVGFAAPRPKRPLSMEWSRESCVKEEREEKEEEEQNQREMSKKDGKRQDEIKGDVSEIPE